MEVLFRREQISRFVRNEKSARGETASHAELISHLC